MRIKSKRLKRFVGIVIKAKYEYACMWMVFQCIENKFKLEAMVPIIQFAVIIIIILVKNAYKRR